MILNLQLRYTKAGQVSGIYLSDHQGATASVWKMMQFIISGKFRSTDNI